MTISGVSQGRVKKIELEPNSRVLVTFSVPPTVVPKVDATAKISAGFFSADSRVLFNPGSDGAPALAEDQVIQGSMDPGITGKFAGPGRPGRLGDDRPSGHRQSAHRRRSARDASSPCSATMNAHGEPAKTSGDEAEKTMRSLQALCGPPRHHRSDIAAPVRHKQRGHPDPQPLGDVDPIQEHRCVGSIPCSQASTRDRERWASLPPTQGSMMTCER